MNEVVDTLTPLEKAKCALLAVLASALVVALIFGGAHWMRVMNERFEERHNERTIQMIEKLRSVCGDSGEVRADQGWNGRWQVECINSGEE